MLFNKPIFSSVVLVFALHLPVFAQQAPSPQQALQNFGIGSAQIEQLERGEIVSYEVSETSKKELGIGLAMIIPVALPKIIDYIRKGNLTITENDLITTGPLFANSDLSSFQKFGFNNTQINEAKAFLNAKPGDSFNLSKQELDSLKPLQISLEDIDRETLIKTANRKYQEFLLQRFTAYRKNGLSGIAAYSRVSGIADPAEELCTDAINSTAWAQYFPELQQAWLNYPATLPASTNEQFLWLNRRVEDRPTAILAHRLIATSETGGILLSRQFYVGHSYNSSHVVTGGLPYKDGTLVFYSTRSSTDQVAGMGSSLKHSIGRVQMKNEMIKRLQRISKDMKLEAVPMFREN